MNGIGEEQHDTIVCTTLRHNLSRQPATFHVLCVRYVLRMCIPSIIQDVIRVRDIIGVSLIPRRGEGEEKECPVDTVCTCM